MDKKVKVNISNEELHEATQLISNALLLLKPYLVALSAGERQTMAKMSDKTYPFVEKTLDYTQSSSQFIPPYMKQEELKANFRAYEEFTQLLRLATQLRNGLDDSSMTLGGECYLGALNYYNSVKHASKTNVPGAKAIYEDLSKRFAKNKSEANDTSNPERETE